MPTYLFPDPDLPYTSAPEDDVLAHLTRRINAAYGLPQGRTMRIGEWYSSTPGKCLNITNDQYADFVARGFLSTYETTNATNTQPAGYAESTTRGRHEVQPWVDYVYVVIGDSILRGGFVDHEPEEKFHSLVLDTSDPLVLYEDEHSCTPTTQSLNCAIDSSQYNDTIAPLEDWLNIYPWMVGDMTFSPTQTPIFIVGLGSNDMNNSTLELTGAQTWALAEDFIAQLKTDFPLCKVIMCTVIARSSSSTKNNVIIDYNALVNSNYLTAGADAVADFAANPECNPATPSVTTDTNYYSADGTHPKQALTAVLAETARDTLISNGWI